MTDIKLLEEQLDRADAVVIGRRFCIFGRAI